METLANAISFPIKAKKWVGTVLDEFFAQHCRKHCSTNNLPPSEVIGVAALAHPDLVIEIVAVAALPDQVADADS